MLEQIITKKNSFEEINVHFEKLDFFFFFFWYASVTRPGCPYVLSAVNAVKSFSFYRGAGVDLQ